MKRFLLTLGIVAASIATPVFLSTFIDLPAPVAERELESAIASDQAPVDLASEEESPFTDLEGHWAEEYMMYLYERGVISGYSDGTAGPDKEVTRAELLKITLGAFNYALSDYSFDPYPFTDVGEADWFREYVDEAYAFGIISGTYPDTFRPGDNANRAEALKIVIEASGDPDLNSVTPNFNDVSPYSDWFASYTAFAKARSIVSGDSSGNFNPSNSTTRGEISKMVVRMIESLASQSNP